MSNERDTTPIQSRYAQQYSKDLAANREEQTALSTEIGALQERLEQLREDEAWLVQAQGRTEGQAAGQAEDRAERTASSEVSAAAAEGAAENEAPVEAKTGPTAPAPVETAAVPKPRQGKRAKAAASKPPVKKAPAKRTSARKTAAKRPAPETVEATPKSKTKAEPPLHALVLGVLLQTPGEARPVREISNALTEAHPQRATSIQVVRNNLEKLAKDRAITKSTEGGAVTYTASAGPADGPVEAAEAAPEAAAAEAVPAEV